MPRSVASDFLDIHSTGSYDTWSVSRNNMDDDTDSRYEYEREQTRRRGGRRRFRSMDYYEEENSIVDTRGESPSTTSEQSERRTATVTESGSYTSGEVVEDQRVAEYIAGRRSMYNPFDDTTSEGSSLPSDERSNRNRSQRGSVLRARHQPWHQPHAPLHSTGSLLDEDSQGPLSPVEENSVASSELFSQPSDEQSRRDVREIQQQLRRAYNERRHISHEQVRRIVEQQESALPRNPQAEYPDPTLSLSMSSSPKKSTSSDPSTGEETVSSESDANHVDDKPQLALHDLCSEATSPDDVAWRNALYLLSLEPELATTTEDGWSPLHICCLGSAPPPDYMVRAILYCEPSCARAIDDGGRLPLHMIAASSANPSIMQLLVEEYPQAVYKIDGHGLTPLHMLMRNDEVDLTMDRVRILLGQTVPRGKRSTKKDRLLQRRGDHLELNVDEINRMVNRPSPGEELDISFESHADDQRHEVQMKNYPDDVQLAFQRLGMWKRRQKRINKDAEGSPIKIELAQSIKDEEKNPAAIAAPPHMQLPLHMAVRRRDVEDEPFEDEDYYYDVQNPPSNRNEIIRVIISAYPRGLVTRDAKGHTPLMIVLLNQDCLPNIELIQLLLGMTTSGFQSPPEWADDLPLHECPEGSFTNPAMVPNTETNQLPLHVAAEEMPSFYAGIESIHSAYPGAVVVQDVRGRTPLHMALRNYQRIQPDPKVVSLLLTDKVAQIRDDDGFLPFDLLVGGAHNLPKDEPMPSMWEDSTFDPSSVYKRFFIYVVMQAPRPRNRTEARTFLQRLRMLPPWLRRQACTVGFIQDMLIFEMAGPEKCALIIFNGVAWAVLLLTFRLQMDEYTMNSVGVDSVYAPVIYTLCALILVGQFISWCISASLSVFVSQCLMNIWPWIDIASASLTIAATRLVQEGSTDANYVASIGTAATGLLWASAIGYFARWWYGMAVFMGRTLRMFHVLIWPLVALLVLIVATAEMFYTYNLTTSQEECDVVLGGRSLCNIREAFITVYLLLLGTPLIDTDGSQNSLSSGAVVLVCVFTTIFVLFIVSLLISVVSEGLRIDLDDVALGYFWEPKLNFVFSIDDLTTFLCCTKDHAMEKRNGIRKKRFIPKTSMRERLTSTLGDAWTVLDYAIFGGERRRGNTWYVAWCDSASPLGAWPLRIICLIILPIWLAIGLASFGLLWPPQVRRWLFRPSRSSIRNNRDANAAAEYSANQVAGMRGDVLQLKAMSYERSNEVKREILEMKRMLNDAMEE